MTAIDSAYLAQVWLISRFIWFSPEVETAINRG
jgi:hypothetical protein